MRRRSGRSPYPISIPGVGAPSDRSQIRIQRASEAVGASGLVHGARHGGEDRRVRERLLIADLSITPSLVHRLDSALTGCGVDEQSHAFWRTDSTQAATSLPNTSTLDSPTWSSTANNANSSSAAGSPQSQAGHSTASRRPFTSSPRAFFHECGNWARSRPGPPHGEQFGGSASWKRLLLPGRSRKAHPGVRAESALDVGGD